MFAAIRSIRLKLLVSYLLVIAVPIGTLGVYFVDQLGALTIRQAKQAERVGVSQLRANLTNYLGSLVEMSQQVYLNEQISFYLGRRYSDPGVSAEGFYELLQPLFNNYANARPGIRRIGIATNNPTLLANGVEIIRPSEHERYRFLLDRPADSRSSITWELMPESGNTIVLLRSLGYHAANLGTLIIEVSENALYQFMKEESEDVVVSIATPDGIIVSSRVRSLIGLPLDTWLSRDGRSDRYHLTITEEFQLGKSSPGAWTIVKQVPLNRVAAQVRSVKLYGIAASIIIFIVAVLLSVILSRSMTNGIRNLSTQMSAVQRGDFTVRISTRRADEIGKLERSFNTMVVELDRLIEKNYRSEVQRRDLEIRKKDAELYALQSQIDPHFLFNTLEAVVQGIQESRSGTALVIQKLARLFRHSLESHEHMVPIKKELDTVQDYLSIIAFRMERRLSYEISCAKELEDTKIPRFTVQPLVENAVHHGISPAKNGGAVRVSVRNGNGGVEISVRDNGVGIDAETMVDIRSALSMREVLTDTKHIGLVNIHERIVLLFGEPYGLAIESTPGVGTTVTIRLPGNGGSQDV